MKLSFGCPTILGNDAFDPRYRLEFVVMHNQISEDQLQAKLRLFPGSSATQQAREGDQI